MTSKNPWLGLASYEEPKYDGTDYQFCGRDEETLEMVRLIDNNLFVTLYGSSGIGKTSLLRAGVIPILRRKDYFPLYVRLSQEPKKISFAEAIVRKLQGCGLIEEKGAAAKHSDCNDRLFLWEYFATTRFLKEGREVYPVIILDQFEEVFREGDKAKAELLLKQVYLLLNDELEMPDEAGWSSDTNYRFVASIREDFLFVLEDSIDENSLDLYKNNRYRLRPMKQEQARQVVLMPGKDCIGESEKETVAERIITLAKRPQSDDIDTLLLSLVCAGTYDKKNGEKITFADLAVWKDNPMEVYYKDAIKGLSDSQIRYIQQHFIRDDGSRRRVDLTDVKTFFGEAAYNQLTQSANRLFTIGDKGKVELLHDQLGMAVYEERKAFEEQERKKKQKKKKMLISLLAILSIVAGFFFYQNNKLQKTHWKMLENQARYVAEKALQLVDEGDSYTARLLALFALEPPHPFTKESASALVNATTHNTALLPYVSLGNPMYSPNGQKILLYNYNWEGKNTEYRIIETSSGALLKTLVVEDMRFPESIEFSNDSELLVSSQNKDVQILNVSNGDCYFLTGHTQKVSASTFSPDDEFVASASVDSTIRIWNYRQKKCVLVENLSEPVFSISFSPCGKYIVNTTKSMIQLRDSKTLALIDSFQCSTLLDYNIRIVGNHPMVFFREGRSVKCWNILTKEIKEYEYYCHIHFDVNKDGTILATESIDKSGEHNIVIRNTETNKIIKKVHLRENGSVNSIRISPDSHSVLVRYGDNSVGIEEIYWQYSPRFYDTYIKYVYSGWGKDSAPIQAATMSRNGKKIFGSSYEKERGSFNSVYIWDTENGCVIDSFYHDSWISEKYITISGDGQYVAFNTEKQQGIKIIDLQKKEQTLLYKSGHNLCFSQDNRYLLFSDKDSIFKWDIKNRIIEDAKGGEGNTIQGLTIIENGDVLAAYYKPGNGTETSIIKLMNISTGQIVTSLDYDLNDFFYGFYLSSNGKFLGVISSKSVVRVFDVKSGEIILDNKIPGTTCLAFSHMDERIALGTEDGNVIIVDLQSQQQFNYIIKDSEHNNKKINSIEISSDGNWVLTAHNSGFVCLSYCPPLQQLIDETRERFKNRPLTPEERRKYYLE